ncbi:hypothetical protein V1525DRAFT_371857 [Lipomyces kononenkoae]|uniref:Uncharacterized protein n=1 Tax=Lipomyces kononenkoae TaxID=34357 RepID=A0ACC3T8A1_LIPKO
MGNQISQVTPSAPTVGIDSYVDELGDIQYDKTCGSARFMKTVRGRHKDGLVIVKIFIKPMANLSLRMFQRQLTNEREALLEVSHAIGYSKIVETERAGYLVRQYFGNILYDRISIRPFLENIERRWIAFQLLSGLDKCHAYGVHHGDIKTENIVVTAWNWVYLTDFASFKPTFLPEDDPADFSFFFDTSLRRVCYVAPERFYGPGEKKTGSLTDAMDIFSLGCVIAELFLEGAPIFNLSQLFGYRRGTFVPDLSMIDDVEIRSLVRHMISLDPKDRYSAAGYLTEWQNKAFPSYFYNFLHEYVQNITEPSVLRLGHRSLSAQYVEADFRIERIYNEFDKVAYFLKFDQPWKAINDSTAPQVGVDPIPVYLDIPNYHTSVPIAPRQTPEDCGALIFLSIVVSAIRNTATATARLHACDLILALGEQLPDEAKLDRCLPYLVALLDDDFVNVQVAAMRSLTQLMALVTKITPVNENVFPEYILPRLKPLLSSHAVFVRSNYASCISTLAETALRFSDMAQEARKDGSSFALIDAEAENGIASDIGYQGYFDLLRREIVEEFQEHTLSLLADTDSAVKRALLRSISPLCAFLGSQKVNDIILRHIITYLNDKDALLRGAFFDGIIAIATFVGGNSLEEYIMPLMVQALADTEEFVLEKVLYAFTSLAELGLIRRPNLWDLVRITIRFAIHPNLWIRKGVFAFIASATKWLSPADVHCIIRPIVKPFLRCEILDYSEVMLQDFCKAPLSRIVFNTAIKWATEAQNSNFWKSAKEQRMSDIVPMFDGSYSITSSLHNLSITKASAHTEFSDKSYKTEEDITWLKRLHVMGLKEEDLWKLVALREHIWRIAKASKNYRLVAIKREQISGPDMSSVISVNKLGVQLHTYFFDDARKTVQRHVAKPQISESTIKQFKAATALLDALKTIDSYQRRSPASMKLTRTDFPPHWLNGVEGSPRTMAPIFQVGSPPRPSAAGIFMTSPSRVQSNVSTVTRVQTEDSNVSDGSVSNGKGALLSQTSTNKDGQTLSSSGDDRLERQVTGSRELRRRASATSFFQKRDHVGKAPPDVCTSPTVAYGRLDKLSTPDKEDKRQSPAEGTAKSVNAAQYIPPDTETVIETVVYRGHSYTGDDPYILKLLDTVYLDKFMEDIPEFGPLIPLAARPRALVKHTSGVSGPWQPDGVLIAHFEEHKGPINRVVVSPDHNFFLTASDDGTVKIWDAVQVERNVTNRSRQSYKHAPGAKVRCLCFIDNTHCFVSGSTDGVINVVRVDYSTPAGRGIPKYGKLVTLRNYRFDEGEWPVWIEHAKIQSSSILMVATNKSRIVGLNLRSMKLDFTFQNPVHHGVPTCFCIDKKREWLVVGTSKGIMDVWSIRYQIRLKAWGLQAGTPIHRVGLHPTRGKGRWIFVAGGTSLNGDEVTIWDVEKTECREVYRTSLNGGGTPASIEKRYEPVPVEDESTETILSRFASDPVQLLDRTESSIAKGIRSICIGAADLATTFSGDSNFMTDSFSGISRPTGGGAFIVTAGADRQVRFWNTAKPDASSIVSGPMTEYVKPTYNVSSPADHLSIVTEVSNVMDIAPNTNGDSDRNPMPNGNSSRSSQTNRRQKSRAQAPQQAGQTQRNTLITSHQQNILKNHSDTILDVALLCKPYGLIISVDRAGAIKIYS